LIIFQYCNSAARWRKYNAAGTITHATIMNMMGKRLATKSELMVSIETLLSLLKFQIFVAFV